MKYYLMGVFASAVMLYGMSLLYGVTGTTLLHRHRRRRPSPADPSPIADARHRLRDRRLRLQGVAVPFHTWAPDTYEGAPTPITAFLAVASKAAGFVALLRWCSWPSTARRRVRARSCGCSPPPP
jgi:NADH-quinone oxidoreductase subunit N